MENLMKNSWFAMFDFDETTKVYASTYESLLKKANTIMRNHYIITGKIATAEFFQDNSPIIRIKYSF